MTKLSEESPEDLGDIPDHVEYLFSNYFGIRLNRPAIAAPARAWKPQVDMFETEDDMTVIVELAGVQEKEVSVVIDKGFLIIRGLRREIHSHFKKRQYHKIEIDYGPFERIIKLPVEVQKENITATLEDGFLIVKLLKIPICGETTEIKIED